MALLLNIFCLTLFFEAGVLAIDVVLSTNGPAVRGSNVSVTATVVGFNDKDLKFVFWDNADPQHKDEYIQSANTLLWNVSYPRELYEAGDYLIRLELEQKFYFTGIWYNVAEANVSLKLTDTLNGRLILSQNNTERPNTFVAAKQSVNHTVLLPKAEADYLKQNASTVIAYWFIDCLYIDQTLEMYLNYTYPDSMDNHLVDVLVVANTATLPPITTTTTTTTTKTTIEKPTPTTTHKNDNKTTTEANNATVHSIAKRAAKIKLKKAPLEDFICKNTGIVPIGDNYVYGHYQETISVREPITSVNITGMNWLQHGDLMNLQVKYTGSPPFDYCARYKPGHYNITGNETCPTKIRSQAYEFPLVHYFLDGDQHTVLVIIENDIGKVVSRATINIYKATPHGQLSVIVVPVVFCLLAVILVVFGVAYYQHRSRHTVEVADFDFGQQAHLDYKTFKERLRDSFRNVFFGHDSDTESLVGNRYMDSVE